MNGLELKILGSKHVAKQFDEHLRSKILPILGSGKPGLKKSHVIHQ
jgi:hypothetical protein